MKVKCIRVGNSDIKWSIGKGPKKNEILEVIEDSEPKLFKFREFKYDDGTPIGYNSRYFEIVKEEDMATNTTSSIVCTTIDVTPHGQYKCKYKGEWGSIVGPRYGDILTPVWTDGSGMKFNEYKDKSGSLIWYPKDEFEEIKDAKPLTIDKSKERPTPFKKGDKLYCIVKEEQYESVGIYTQGEKDNYISYGQEVTFVSYDTFKEPNDRLHIEEGDGCRWYPPEWFILAD